MSSIHNALYGNISMLRGVCPHCKRTALIIQKCWACCDAPVKDLPLTCKIKRIVEPEQVRKLPNVLTQTQLLNEQNNSCFYCERAFGTEVFTGKRRKKSKILSICWDHKVPWAYGQNNGGYNFVAACQECNSVKSSKMFATIEEAKVYVQTKIERRRKETN